MSFFQTLFAPNVKKLTQSGDVKGLIRALGYEKDSETRKLAAQALGETDDPAVVEPLMSSLRDKCPEVRAAAAEALCKVGDERAVQALSAALEDEEWKVRRYAAEALGNIGDPGAIQPLQKASQARCPACCAVASLGGAEAVSALQGVGSDSYWTNYKEIATELPGLIAKARRA